jgi:uncharacterized protein YdiU (UPF0061 family)
VFSSIDRNGRYAYANQPGIAQWNLARLAEALLPLLAADESEPAVTRAVADATAALESFPALYQAALLRGQREKLGLSSQGDDAADAALANDWLAHLQEQGVDFTLGWRRLADAAAGDDTALRGLFTQAQPLDEWLSRWRARCDSDRGTTPAARAQRMRRANPWIIARNHRVEEALAAASERGDMGPFDTLLAAVRDPYEETRANAVYAEPAPAAVTACYKTFCGT